MKNKNSKHHKTIHQRVEQLARHRLSVALVLGLMTFTVLALDMRIRNVFQQVYAQGWGWMGMYLHHEHPPHLHTMYGVTRVARISGPNE